MKYQGGRVFCATVVQDCESDFKLKGRNAEGRREFFEGLVCSLEGDHKVTPLIFRQHLHPTVSGNSGFPRKRNWHESTVHSSVIDDSVDSRNFARRCASKLVA